MRIVHNPIKAYIFTQDRMALTLVTDLRCGNDLMLSSGSGSGHFAIPITNPENEWENIKSYHKLLLFRKYFLYFQDK